jgi:DNA-binding transcriptional ArsR family regulator
MANHSLAFTRLADATRREIFERIARAPSAVGELADELPVSRPAVSQHFSSMRSSCSIRIS